MLIFHAFQLWCWLVRVGKFECVTAAITVGGYCKNIIWPNSTCFRFFCFLWRLINEINLHWPFCVYAYLWWNIHDFNSKYILTCVYCQGENPVADSKHRSVQERGRVVEVCARKCLRSRGWVKTSVQFEDSLCVCWKCVHSIYAVVYAELTVSSPWWSTHTQPALLSALVCLPPCPRFRFFHQKRKWKHSLLARGREGSGQLVVEAGEKRVGERERKESKDIHIWICSMGTFTGEKVGRGPFWIYW